MLEIVAQFVPQMTHEEKVEMLAVLRRAIAAEFAAGSAPGAPGSCPRCGSPRFVRKGRGRGGSQRWLCRGREGSADALAALPSGIAGAPLVATDGHRSYPAALAELGVGSHVRVDPGGRSTGVVNMVNSLHARLSDFLRRFHGVATRRLQHYLDWFMWAEQFKDAGDRRALLFRHASRGRYRTTRREYARTPHPFMDYWGAVSTVV